MTILDRLWGLWHRLNHSVGDTMIERRPGEVYLRCMKCGLRSVGWQTGPLKIKSRLSGIPERFRLEREVIAVPRHTVEGRATMVIEGAPIEGTAKMTIH